MHACNSQVADKCCREVGRNHRTMIRSAETVRNTVVAACVGQFLARQQECVLLGGKCFAGLLVDRNLGVQPCVTVRAGPLKHTGSTGLGRQSHRDRAQPQGRREGRPVFGTPLIRPIVKLAEKNDSRRGTFVSRRFQVFPMCKQKNPEMHAGNG